MVAVLADRIGLVGFEDVESEASQTREDGGVGADTRAVLAEGDVAGVVRGVLHPPVGPHGLCGAGGGERRV